MGSKGNQVQTQSTQTYSPNPAIAKAGNQALTGAESAAQLPFQQPVAPVAGFNPFQQQSFNQIQGMQGMAQPYFNMGNAYLQGSAAPITGQDVSQYYNPMAQNVTNQLQNIFGQQMHQTTGNATQAAGGVGADRIGVAQANLANQQGLAAGQTYAGLYNQALQTAQQQKQMMAGAGYGLAQMGPAAQNAYLQGTGALGQAGAQQQGLTQAQLSAQYQNQLAQIAYPFQTPQYLAGITGGLAPAFGGTTQGQSTTTYPTPSPLNQALGVGTSLLGLGGAGGLFGGGGMFGGLGSMFGGGKGSYGGGYAPNLYGGQFGTGGAAYGKLAEQKFTNSPVGNPYADDSFDDDSHYADGGDIEQPPPFPGASVPNNSGMSPIPTMGQIPQGISPIPYIPLHPAPMQHPNLDLRPQSKTPPKLQGQETIGGDISSALKLAKGVGLFSASGGAVNPYDFGRGFQDGGDTFDDRWGDMSTNVLPDTLPPLPRGDPREPLGARATMANELSRAGMSPTGIGGTNMAVADESGFNPYSRVADQPRFGGEAHYAHGLFQEGGDEWNKYQSWLKQNHPDSDWRDPALQTRFLSENLKENYPAVFNRMNAANTPGQSAAAFTSGYLKPAAIPLNARMAKYLGSQGAEDTTDLSAKERNPYSTNAPNADMNAGQYFLQKGDQPYPDALKRDWGQNMARSPWMSLVSAGAKMASTVGPVGTAIGKGIEAGVGQLEGQRKELRSEQDINMKAQALYQKAVEHLDEYKRVPAGTAASLQQHAPLIAAQIKNLESEIAYRGIEAQKPVLIRQDMDMYGRTRAVYGVRQPDGSFLDPTTQEVVKPAPVTGGGSEEQSIINSPRPENLKSGEFDQDYLNKLREVNPALAADTERVASGQGKFPTISGGRGPGAAYALMLRDSLNRFGQVDEATFGQRQKTQNDWAPNGKAGQTITSFNYALRHTSDLGELTRGLNESQLRIVNATKNWTKTQFSDPQLEKWRNQALIVATEVPKMLRGAGVLNEQEEARWNERLMGSPNVKTFLGGLGQLGHAMNVRNEELISQYKGIVHKEPPYTLSPEAQQSVSQLEKWRNGDFSSGVPNGSIPGTKGGKPVWKTPDGQYIPRAP